MLASMTGFGRAEVALPTQGLALVEIQTLNHRFLEVECRLPDGFQGLEESLRQRVAQAIRRGRVKVWVHWKGKGPGSAPRFQEGIARQYLSELKAFQRQLRIPGTVTLETILNLPQVVVSERVEELPSSWGRAVQGAAAQALERVQRMRRQEGHRLKEELTRLTERFSLLVRRVRHRIPRANRSWERRLTQRIGKAARRTGLIESLDPKIVTQEIAGFVQGTDVTEEMARIESHLAGLRQLLAGREGATGRSRNSGESPGRTIDFLAQELQREVTTLGAKARDAAIIRSVVAMKGQVEKLREQAANIE